MIKIENKDWYWLGRVLDTRTYGVTYVHTSMRNNYAYACVHVFKDITFTYRGYGKSLIGGGHKYKAYAHRGSKPVPTKEIKAMLMEFACANKGAV